MKTKQINQFNSRGNREGYWEGYFKNGQLCWKGHYVNGVLQEEKPQVVLSMQQIAEKFNISVEQLKITKE